MEEERGFTIDIELQKDYQFLVTFDDALPPLLMDEPEPLGDGAGPNASRVLAAAIGNCLSASALFCLRRARVDVQQMSTAVSASLVRNEEGRLRVGSVRVRIEPRIPEADRPRAARCLDIFESYCVVTQSVRTGIDIGVTVDIPGA